MITSRFRYERPALLAEALREAQRLIASGEPFIFSAGGTDLVPALKHRGSAFWGERSGTVISLSALIELSGITLGATLRVGALTRVADLAVNAEVTKRLPGLAEAASRVASPQIRNRATVGGNLLVDHRCTYINQSEQNRASFGPCFKAGGETCHLIKNAMRGKMPLCQARFVSDLAPVLIALEARLSLVSPRGTRSVPLAEFYRPDGIDRNGLAPDELLVHVEVDLSQPRNVVYQKLRIRNTIDFPSLGVAVGVDPKQWTVSLTGVENHPPVLRYERKSESLDALIERAGQDALKASTPMKQDFLVPGYRRRMIPVLIRRAFLRNLEEAPWTSKP